MRALEEVRALGGTFRGRASDGRRLHAGAMNGDVTYFAETNYHGRHRPFGIKQADRLSHMYAIGKTGVGKSSMIATMIRQDIDAGRGCALIDPHGDLVEQLYAGLSEEAQARTTYLNVPDPKQPFGYNPLRAVHYDRIPLAVSGLIETLRKLWPDAWGVRMEHVLRNSLFALLEQPNSSLPDILRLYTDNAFRKTVASSLRNPTVRTYWLKEFEAYTPRMRAEMVAPVQNKLGALLADPTLFRVLCSPSQPIRFRPLMDRGDILLVNVSKGHLGEDAAHIVGAMVASTIALAAFTRAQSDASGRRPFFVYLDEFQNFTTLSFVNMLAELRKYGVGLILAHQHLQQVDVDIRHAVLGNTGSTISFRIGSEDAALLAREFYPRFSSEDFVNLPNRSLYLRLMIDGAPSPPFSAKTI